MSEIDFSAMRAAMVSSQLRTNHVSDPRIVAALENVSRERFVPAERAALAYVDVPVPLGGGRALNAPLVTARLILEANIRSGEKVLLIGAATGYAAALLLELGAKVTALEADETLIRAAQANLGKNAGLAIVSGALEEGWRKSAPYNVILIDGAIEAAPPALVAQLAADGRMVTGLVDKGVTRLASGTRAGKSLGLVPFADLETVRLPGFAAPSGFIF